MTIEISNIQTKFNAIYWLIDDFFGKKARHTEVEILSFNFPEYTKQIKSIEESWRSCFQYATDVIRQDFKFLPIFIDEFNGFHNQIINAFYEGFEKKYELGRTQSITYETLNKDADLLKTLIEEFSRIGFDKYKVILFDLLNAFKREVIDFGIDKAQPYNQEQPIFNLQPEQLFKINDLAIEHIVILKLYDLLHNEGVIKEMDLGEFLRCFDFNNEPKTKPEILQKYVFVYALMQIPNMKLAIAKKNFGIKDYDIIKSKINNPKDILDRPKDNYFSAKTQFLTHKIDKVLQHMPKN